jgi:superfamily II helicase
MAPESFQNVGLVVFDECHLLHPDEGGGRRGLDAMLCLLALLELAPASDVLL